MLTARLVLPGLVAILSCLPSGSLVRDNEFQLVEDPKVVLISIAGVGAIELEAEFRNARLPVGGGFDLLRRGGSRARSLIPIPTPITGSTRATLVTGAYPDHHGVAGNRFHLRGDSITSIVTGLTQGVIQSETLSEAATRQGKRVIRIGQFPSGSGPLAGSDRFLNTGSALGESRILTLRSVRPVSPPAGTDQYEFTRSLETEQGESNVTLSATGRPAQIRHAMVSAIDTVRDRRARFQAVRLQFRDASTPVVLCPGQWSLILLQSSFPRVGAWVKLLELDSLSGGAKLYLGAPHQNEGYPAAFVAGIDDSLGPWPGGIDLNRFLQGAIDGETLLEQSIRENEFLLETARLVTRDGGWDLLMLLQPIMDHTGHQFWLRDPRQRDYPGDAARVHEYAGLLRRGLLRLDANLGLALEWWSGGATLLVASEFGLVPAHTRVAINRVLKQSGINAGPTATSVAIALNTAATVNIRFNVAGREPGGIVQPSDTLELQSRVITVLRNLKDPTTGEPVFETVLRGQELEQVHLRHPRAAPDVWGQLKPGYTVTDAAFGEGPIIDHPMFIGEHGYASRYRETHGVFLGYQAGGSSRLIDPVLAVDVVPTVANLLGIHPPGGSQGSAIEFWR
jgi:predicted AlkP superfamily phosphohydrolase/phosphomutase